MNDSQGSNVFSQTPDCIVQDPCKIMDMDSYDSLLANTKKSLQDLSSCPESFKSLLQDCHICILQSFELLNNILSNACLNIQKLIVHIEDTTIILNMLSDYIKNVLQVGSMRCDLLKSFPTVIGQILLEVFIHCKNSEQVYADHLNKVEKQLKSLFLSCHELQQIYLLALEKHFIFDLTLEDEKEILVEALRINLRIGEIVQALDVKTMAVQWKAYTSLCEKYSCYLLNTKIFMESSEPLCAVVLNGLQIVIETENDEKLVLRTMKVTNFTIKLLTKICTIFKDCDSKPSLFVDLLISLYLYNPSYLETVNETSPQLIHVISTNIYQPAEILLKELLLDCNIYRALISVDIMKLREDDKLLGYFHLLLATMKYLLQTENKLYCKGKLVRCLFNVFPECYTWINMGLKYKVEMKMSQEKTMDLFEYALTYATAFTLNMDYEEMLVLENCLLEAVLGVDTLAALLASNLWIMLARNTSNTDFIFKQLLTICRMYQSLENSVTFRTSPQKVHLSYTISSLFMTMDSSRKIKILKEFDITSPSNYGLWSVLKIKNLPIECVKPVEVDIVEKFKHESKKSTSESFYDLIDITNLIATCSPRALDDLEEFLMDGWSKVCPKHLNLHLELTNTSNVWYLDYVEALASLTCAMKCVIYRKSFNIVKILHIVSCMISLGNVDLKLLVINLICKLTAIPIHDENNVVVENIVRKSFNMLIHDTDFIVRNRLFRAIKHCSSKYLEHIVNSIVGNEESLLRVWNHFLRPNTIENERNTLKTNLIYVSDLKFEHKCISKQNNERIDFVQDSCNSNFDLADIESLLDAGSDSEPATKRQKLDNNTEVILNRLETDVISLCNVKDNVISFEHKNRIRTICDKLNKLISK